MQLFRNINDNRKNFYLTILIIVISVNSYYFNYTWPNIFYWDEVYHVASAQKYLNGVFFMEQHPPLGKLLIAAGEWLLKANEVNDQFINVEFAASYPKGHSMFGYRFFPAFMGWMTAPVFFLLLLKLTENRLIAFFLSFLYIFDDALIIQSRAAMLDSMLIFFLVVAFYLTVITLDKINKKTTDQDEHLPQYHHLVFLVGLSVGSAAAVKLTGLIGVALFLPFIWSYRKKHLYIFTHGSIFSIGVLFAVIMSYSIHLAISQTIEPRLEADNRIELSEKLKNDLNKSIFTKLTNLPEVMARSLEFTSTFNNGVPRTNLCLEGQNSSPPFLWPTGGRAINYVWEKADDSSNKYIFLHSNPAVWLITLLGIFLGTVLAFTPAIHQTSLQLTHAPILYTSLIMYFSYMFIISLLDRQMYLYHYLPALLIGFVIMSLTLVNLQKAGNFTIQARHKELIAIMIGMLIFFSHQQYRPLTYYQPISHQALRDLAIIDNWDLRCPDCELTNTLASPISTDKSK